jgi:energy-coupling factor transport system permease protein
MLKDITIGQFFPGKSFIHKMDPRMKIILMFGLIVFVFMASNAISMGMVLLSTVLILLITRVPFKLYFKGLKAIWMIIILTSLLNMFYIKGTVIFEWRFISITWEGVRQSIFITLRIVCMILISSVLTYTSSPTALTDAIERLLSPFKLIGLKVHELAMMMTIALRFIPTLIEEVEKIMNAQKARGADMDSGRLTERIRAMIPIFIPLFVSSIRRAVELAAAMECRCYTGGKGRTRMKVLRYKFRDFFAFTLIAALCAGVIWINFRFPEWKMTV